MANTARAAEGRCYPGDFRVVHPTATTSATRFAPLLHCPPPKHMRGKVLQGVGGTPLGTDLGPGNPKGLLRRLGAC